MTQALFNNAILAILLLTASLVFLRTYSRRALDVMEDLRDEDLDVKDILDGEIKNRDRNGSRSSKISSISMPGTVLNDELAELGLFEAHERRKFSLFLKLLPLIGGGVFLTPSLLGLIKGAPITFTLVSIGMGLGLIARRVMIRRRRNHYIREIVFFLPVVMERIVMAVQAGLDIIPAIKAATSLSDDNHEVDPVTRLLKVVAKLTESGLGFEQSLKEIAATSHCSALKHAFLHLAVAQKEGGILVMPLRELSDSTQLYYQESIEEEIAEMPVKATMPLICTFAGLLLCFLVPPFLQILSILSENMPGTK